MKIERIIVDLSYGISGTMLVYPGLSRPVLEWLAVFEQDGHWSSKITLPVHVGTHVDAPKHFIEGGAPVDQVSLYKLVGEAVMIDVSQRNLHEISRADLEPFTEDVCEGDIVIINTGTYRKYGTKEFVTAYPHLKPDAARWLVDKGIRGLGIDTMAIDPLKSPESPAHHIILGAGIPIVENLTNLDLVKTKRFFSLRCP